MYFLIWQDQSFEEENDEHWIDEIPIAVEVPEIHLELNPRLERRIRRRYGNILCRIPIAQRIYLNARQYIRESVLESQ